MVAGLASIALAHPLTLSGDRLIVENAFLSGFSHPWSGWDHWLAMVSIGLWAYGMGRRARFWLPGAFVSGMLIGCVLGFSWGPTAVSAGLWESFVALTILILGTALWASRPVNVGLAAGIAFWSGMVHGHVHGTELIGAHGFACVAGVVLSTVTLHGFGLLLASGVERIERHHLVLRSWGVATSLAGIWLLVTSFRG